MLCLHTPWGSVPVLPVGLHGTNQTGVSENYYNDFMSQTFSQFFLENQYLSISWNGSEV